MDFYRFSKGMHWAEKALYLCLALVLLLIPFDAYFLPLKTGPITIYPYFLGVFGGVFFSFLIPGNKKTLPLNFKLLLGLGTVWVIVALSLLLKVHDKHRSLYAVRSILFLWLHLVLVFRVWQVMPLAQLRQWLNNAVQVMLFFLIVCGFFEYLTGIHLVGAQTVKIMKEPIGDFTYAPMAFYDNPNNYMVYLLSSVFLFLYLNEKLRKNISVLLGFTMLLFFFAEVADSRFGIIISFMMIGYVLLMFGKEWISRHRIMLTASLLSLVFGATVFLTFPRFLGPMWKKSPQYTLNEIAGAKFDVAAKRVSFIRGDSLVKIIPIDSVVAGYRHFKGRTAMPSTQIRVNLNKNSWDLIKLSKGLGVGPGQYSWYYENGFTRYPTTTVTNPHNAFAEIAVEYGVLMIVLLLAFFVYLWREYYLVSKQNKDYELFYWHCLFMLVLPCLLNVPSAYLNLNIGWWLLIILVMVPEFNKTKEV
jgi:teichuronic acid biosynthesis protein TuaE